MNTIEEFTARWLQGALGKEGVRAICRRQGWSCMRTGLSCIREPLCLAGQTYASGLGTHADSEILLRADQPMRRIRATVGVDDNRDTRRMNSRARIRFSIHVGTRELWRSRELMARDQPESVDLSLPEGVQQVVLQAIDTDGVFHGAHADWAGLTVTTCDGQETDFSSLGEQHLPEMPPVAFLYGGQPSSQFLPTWQREQKAGVKLPEGITEQRVTWTDPATGMELALEFRSFEGFPAVEWVGRFTNRGNTDSPILSDIQALSATWLGEANTRLFRSRGSRCLADDFQLLDEPLTPGSRIQMAAGGGRSSNDWLPFFNLQSGNMGVITAIGWTGQWAAEFIHNYNGLVTFQAGMEKTNLTLHPGESIRTPRMLLLFWQGDRLAAHNQLRQFILRHHTPRPNGKALEGPLTVAHWGGMKTADHLARIDVYRRQKLGYDYYWIDAGWYGPADSYSPDEHTGDWAQHVGNWNINPAAHPHGLRPISDAAAAAGMKFLLWFEPERAVVGTPLTVEYPEWFLGERTPGGNLLFDLGNPAARRWLTEFISGFLTAQGIHLYRQDFNFDPLPYWRSADAPDRQGIREIRHIEGLYAFWDELLRRHPGLVIDNCSSGGRRIDLETISRSIPLWRSDWQCCWTNDPAPCQTETMGLSYWVPLSGAGVIGGCRRAGDTYNFRSSLSAAIQFAIFMYESFPIQADYPWAWHQRMLADYRRARPLFRGDYYPMTLNVPDQNVWAVFQMHRPDLEEGMLLAFRRKDSPFISADFRLQALAPDTAYELEDADTGGRTWRQTGKELATTGVRVTLEQAPGSQLIFYRKSR